VGLRVGDATLGEALGQVDGFDDGKLVGTIVETVGELDGKTMGAKVGASKNTRFDHVRGVEVSDTYMCSKRRSQE
jgi:hypothetical protein